MTSYEIKCLGIWIGIIIISYLLRKKSHLFNYIAYGACIGIPGAIWGLPMITQLLSVGVAALFHLILMEDGGKTDDEKNSQEVVKHKRKEGSRFILQMVGDSVDSDDSTNKSDGM